ncbi:Mbeg1-like protein [Aerococcus tenax]|uniref:Mbeg1-like protein n=1 Tax=Aerococcus tenax TaxID=3078812 RepID=UPI0018A7D57E|nr:Mbeg1-like protein [Aerococcus tenax]
MRIVDYLKVNKDQSFSDLALNEVDIAALTELSNLPIAGLLPSDLSGEDYWDLPTLYQALKDQDYSFQGLWQWIMGGRYELLEAMVDGQRFQDIRLYGFNSQLNREAVLQFAALVVEVPDHFKIIAFRGTDDHLVGWRENFKLAYQKAMPSQKSATDYLRQVLDYTADPEETIIVSGHSKGGNLAVVASIQQDKAYQDRLNAVYAFDSPGIHRETLAQENFHRIQGRIHEYVPEDSLIGIILYAAVKPVVVRSSGISLMQHLMEMWEVEETHFEQVQSTTPTSQLAQATMNVWMQWQGQENIERFFFLVFELLNQTGIDSFKDVDQDFSGFIGNLYREGKSLDRSTQRFLMSTLNDLVLIGRALKRRRQTSEDSYYPQSIKNEVLQQVSHWHQDQPWVSVLVGGALIFSGLVLLVKPSYDLSFLAGFFLLVIFISGLWDLRYFWTQPGSRLRGTYLLAAILAFVLSGAGIYFGGRFLPVQVGVWMIGLSLIRAWQFYRIHRDHWDIPLSGLLLSLVTFVMGIVLIRQPHLSAYLPILLALGFILLGLVMVVSLIIYQRESELYDFIDHWEAEK